MKTKNVKVRVKDIKQGVTIYIAHPVYGIEKVEVTSKPYINKHTKLLFMRFRTICETWGEYEGTHSLWDAGITSTYNDRRSFFKLKHAEEWVRKWSKDKGFIRRHAEHEERCRWCDEIEHHQEYN